MFLASTATYMAYGNYRVMNRSNLYEMYLGQLPELVESDLFLNTRPEYGDFPLCLAQRRQRHVDRHAAAADRQHAAEHDAFGLQRRRLDLRLAQGAASSVPTSSPTRTCTTRGSACSRDYRVVITGNHPEYYLDADVGCAAKPSSAAAGG